MSCRLGVGLLVCGSRRADLEVEVERHIVLLLEGGELHQLANEVGQERGAGGDEGVGDGDGPVDLAQLEVGQLTP